MGCDASRTFKIAAKWSISSHGVAGPYHSMWPGLIPHTLTHPLSSKTLASLLLSVKARKVMLTLYANYGQPLEETF